MDLNRSRLTANRLAALWLLKPRGIEVVSQKLHITHRNAHVSIDGPAAARRRLLRHLSRPRLQTTRRLADSRQRLARTLEFAPAPCHPLATPLPPPRSGQGTPLGRTGARIPMQGVLGVAGLCGGMSCPLSGRIEIITGQPNIVDRRHWPTSITPPSHKHRSKGFRQQQGSSSHGERGGRVPDAQRGELRRRR
jgi:hypothetical protein